MVIGGSNRMLSTAEAAELTGYARSTIQRRWRELGLPGVKYAKHVHFRERDVLAWIEAKERATYRQATS